MFKLRRLDLKLGPWHFRYTRNAGQNLVEFGLIVAVVALVGMAGLNLLGRAVERYFVPLADDLAPTAPVGTDDVVHPTTVTIWCIPNSVNENVPAVLNCSFTVVDAWPTKRTPPAGTVQLQVSSLDFRSSTAIDAPCLLAPDLTTPDPADSTCGGNFLWQNPSGAGIHHLTAHYVPTDGTHRAPNPPDAFVVVTVRMQLNIAFTPDPDPSHGLPSSIPCSDAQGFFPGEEKVEIGHPIVCHISVTDSRGRGVSTPIQLTARAGAGRPFFSCFLNNNRSALSTCPTAANPYLTSTDANGNLTFVYRRMPEDNGLILGLYSATWDRLMGQDTDKLTATATDYELSTSPHSIIMREPLLAASPALGHSTDMSVHCDSNVPVGGQVTRTIRSGLSVATDAVLTGTGTTLVPCHIGVVDTDPQNVYISGNLELETSSPPHGSVYFMDQNNQPVPDQTGVPATCSLSTGNLLPPGYLPQQLRALPEYASTCSVTLKLSSLQTTITAYYDGEPMPLPDNSGPHLHRPAADQPTSRVGSGPISVTFN